jgi:hypothetical protein
VFHQDGGEKENREINGQKESMMQWQRKDWKKDSGLIEKNDDLKDVNDRKHTYRPT